MLSYAKRTFMFVLIGILPAASDANAQAVKPEKTILTRLVRFCPSWAEAHERTLASISGRKPDGVRWKGCIWLNKGTQVQTVSSDEYMTEIVFKGMSWFADEGVFPTKLQPSVAPKY